VSFGSGIYLRKGTHQQFLKTNIAVENINFQQISLSVI